MVNKQHERLTKLITLGILSAMAFIVMYFLRIPMVAFLKYDPKDIIICIAGFIYGPMSAFAVSVVVSLVEMFLASETGVIGFVMNILGSCAFACTASFIYKRNKTIKNAVIGLISGVLMMTAVMLLWNWLITPMYLNKPRQDVVGMLVPIFLPFNLIKGGINACVTILLYKPLVGALRKAHLAPASLNSNLEKTKNGNKINLGLMLVSLFVLITIIFILLVVFAK